MTNTKFEEMLKWKDDWVHEYGSVNTTLDTGDFRTGCIYFTCKNCNGVLVTYLGEVDDN